MIYAYPPTTVVSKEDMEKAKINALSPKNINSPFKIEKMANDGDAAKSAEKDSTKPGDTNMTDKEKSNEAGGGNSIVANKDGKDA